MKFEDQNLKKNPIPLRCLLLQFSDGAFSKKKKRFRKRLKKLKEKTLDKYRKFLFNETIIERDLENEIWHLLKKIYSRLDSSSDDKTEKKKDKKILPSIKADF